jgi:hypothetical protein
MAIEFSEVYARPGEHHIIDAINPHTGLTLYGNLTEAQMKERDPQAVRMPWSEYQKARSAQQHTPITWEPTTHEKYHEMLGVLPPALWLGGAFLVGEPDDHDIDDGAPRFRGYRHRDGAYFVASRPMTCNELRKEMGQPAGNRDGDYLS